MDRLNGEGDNKAAGPSASPGGVVIESRPNDEWYTADRELNACRLHAGVVDFDLDPCSTMTRQLVGLGPTALHHYFSGEHDGLSLPWFGNVFCNPPYSQIDRWVDKANFELSRPAGMSDFVNGTIPPYSVTFLVPANRTEQEWFHKLLSVGARIAFLRGRRPFHDRQGKLQKRPRFGLMIVCVGDANLGKS